MNKLSIFFGLMMVLFLICGVESCMQNVDDSNVTDLNTENDSNLTEQIIIEEKPLLNENELQLDSYDNYPDVTELHWGRMPITYFIKNPGVCGSNVVEQIKQAFDIIENETGGAVSFEFKKGEGNISIECFDRYDNEVIHLASSRTYAEAGLGVFDDGVGNVISNGEIRLFKITLGQRYYGRCSTYPDTIIHEILHLFGFEDNDHSNSIMYRYITSCIGEIDQEIIDKLKEAYS